MAAASSDLLGNALSTSDAGVVAAIDDFVGSFLSYETRAANVVAAARAAADSPLLNAYAGALYMLMESPAGPPKAREFLRRAEASSGANPREQAAIAFLGAWAADDVPVALDISARAVAEWPRDLVMAKLNQYLAFNGGDAPAMLRTAQTAAAASADVPQVHGMLAFAFEQCHQLGHAEAAANRALEMTRREPWAQHALAHVMITQGRIDEGARFMESASDTWTGLNSFMATHNWWHLALFYLSQGRGEDVLRLFDDRCWTGDRDYSQDQVNAVSLLARLELAGVDVGDRWGSVAEHLAKRGADVEQPFLSLHYLYGLARAGRDEAAPVLAAFRDRAREAPPYSRAAWAEVALPLAEGVAAHLAGDHAVAARRLEAALPRLGEIGGSHAQRDLFEQIHLAALTAAGRWTAVQQILERRRAFDPEGVPLNLALASAYDALDLPIQAAEARARAARNRA